MSEDSAASTLSAEGWTAEHQRAGVQGTSVACSCDSSVSQQPPTGAFRSKTLSDDDVLLRQLIDKLMEDDVSAQLVYTLACSNVQLLCQDDISLLALLLGSMQIRTMPARLACRVMRVRTALLRWLRLVHAMRRKNYRKNMLPFSDAQRKQFFYRGALISQRLAARNSEQRNSETTKDCRHRLPPSPSRVPKPQLLGPASLRTRKRGQIGIPNMLRKRAS